MANATNAEKPTTTPRRTDRLRMQTPRRPTLRFTPLAWAKLLFLRDLGETEVGGFGISSENDLLLIEDIQMVRQRCTSVTVQFEDAAVADFFDEQVDRGLAEIIHGAGKFCCRLFRVSTTRKRVIVRENHSLARRANFGP